MCKNVDDVFNKIKKLINDDSIKILVDNQFYFTKNSVDFVNNLDKRYFLNSYYDLNTLDILLMIESAKNLEEVKKQLNEDYESDYSNSLYQNFTSALESGANLCI